MISFAFTLPFLADPAPSVLRRRAYSRRLDCDRISVDVALQRFPGTLNPIRPRGEGADRVVLSCAERLIAPGVREEGTEAILQRLSDTAQTLATAASGYLPDLQGRTWLVEAYYPDNAMVDKIAFATKTALIAEGLAVSDRTPTPSAGDVDVLTRMSPFEAYPAACMRYRANGSLREGDVLLAVMQLDPRATSLHAGLCIGGDPNRAWTWLR